MSHDDVSHSQVKGLAALGFTNIADVHWNLSPASLYEEFISGAMKV
jgi:hypothetical protein